MLLRPVVKQTALRLYWYTEEIVFLANNAEEFLE